MQSTHTRDQDQGWCKLWLDSVTAVIQVAVDAGSDEKTQKRWELNTAWENHRQLLWVSRVSHANASTLDASIVGAFPCSCQSHLPAVSSAVVP